MKANKKEIIISIVICLLPMVLGFFMWGKLPDMIPTHFGFNNEPNGYSGKLFAVVGLPCILAVIHAACLFFLNRDPKVSGHSKALSAVMLWFIPLLSCILVPMCLFASLGKNINVALFVQILAGIFFIVVGNYLPKCRQNYTMGIRLPWTLKDENNWNYTHRIGGFVMVIAGFLTVLNAFFGSLWILLAIIIAATLIPAAASYIYYRKHNCK